MAITIRLLPLRKETCFAPLGVLGYCLTRTRFYDPVFTELDLPLKAVEHEPHEKLLDLLVSLLAGCRSIAQVNASIRPDLALAQAWGRQRFAEQSSLARTLDAFKAQQVAAFRQGSEALLHRESRALQHDFARDWLWIDLDLTDLPISKHAEGATKGKIGDKKMPMAVSWPGRTPPSITRPSSPASIQATSTATRLTSQPCKAWQPSPAFLPLNAKAPSCAPIRALAATIIWIMPSTKAGRC